MVNKKLMERPCGFQVNHAKDSHCWRNAPPTLLDAKPRAMGRCSLCRASRRRSRGQTFHVCDVVVLQNKKGSSGFLVG
jgi:hypothetical protein